MHQMKYTRDWTRRYFLEQVGKGVIATGVLAPLWDVIGRHGEVLAAYPEELRSIEAYTKGRVKVGSQLDTSNVEILKDVLDPALYQQVKTEGRVARIGETTNNADELLPKDYLAATARNQGQAMFDASQNVVTKDGKPWIGGNPFPSPKTAAEVLISNTLSWGRHDISFYPIDTFVTDSSGRQLYRYKFVFIEYQTIGRISVDPKPYLPGYLDKLRYQPTFGLYPEEQQGVGFLQIWPYDQRKFPDFYSYLPVFKRVRTLPVDQRFESLFPGLNAYFSDAWATGDPLLTWGNFKLVGRGPLLGFANRNWNAAKPNWEHETTGGPQKNRFSVGEVELVPDVITVDMSPTGYPRAPYSKKRIWFDARSMLPLQMIAFDRQDKPWKAWTSGFSIYKTKSGQQWPESGAPYWSFSFAEAFDMQSGQCSRLEQVKELPGGGWTVRVNDPSVFTSFCNLEALQRLGSGAAASPF